LLTLDSPLRIRPAEEVTHAAGGAGARVAAPGIGVWNPGFDVTPAALISGIITERGVLRRAAGASVFDVRAFLGLAPPRCVALDCDAALAYAAARPELASRLGGAGPADWAASEVGDGNINFVYILRGPDGALVLKQALPYIRLVGESWPLGTGRLAVEAEALRRLRAACPAHVPEVYSWDEARSIMAMRYVEPPHAILRGALVRGDSFPLLAPQLGSFLAQALFRTSALALGAAVFRARAAELSNGEMCELTEKVVFTSPYHACADNRHTSPALDGAVAALRADAAAKAAASALRLRFSGERQALLHGDLHTGSVMACAASLFVIDAEFAFYGPIGFDLGAFLANLLLALFASPGLERQAGAGPRAAQRAWLLSALAETYETFEAQFRALWADAAGRCELLGAGAAAGGEALAALQHSFMRSVFTDAVGFAGAKMVRRLVGIAHVEDMEAIAEAGARGRCELAALAFGRRLLVEAASFASMQEVAAAAEAAVACLI